MPALVVLAVVVTPPYWQRIEAALVRPRLASLVSDAGHLAAEAEDAPPRQAAASWQAVARAASRCGELLGAAPPVDRDWAPPGAASIAELERSCTALGQLAGDAAGEAQAADRARLEALTAAARGDRARIVGERGEPLVTGCTDGDVPCVLRAREWSYVTGPEGPLDTYDTTIFVFTGDRLTGQRQRRAHEHP